MSSLAFSSTAPRQAAPTWAWAAGLFLAAGLALGAGYLGTAAVRTYFFAHAAPKGAGADSLALADIRIYENLPLYAAVDDLDFLNQLSAPEFFGDEATPPEGLVPAQPLEIDKPSEKQLKELVKAFRELPAEQQEKIRTLDQQVNAQESARRDQSFRLLETYVAWLERLSEIDRKDVLVAPTSAKRLEACREVHRKQWIASLPAAQRQKLKDLSPSEKADLTAKWRAEEEKNRADWSVARVQWEALRTGRQPWPFIDERMKKDVLAYANAAYHPGDSKRNRLSSLGTEGGDAARFKEAADRADKGEWVLIGKAVYDFSRKYEMLPEPGKGNPVVEAADLSAWPNAVKLLERPKMKKNIETYSGKWPEFALAVHSESPTTGKPLIGFPSYHLGPCKPDDFKDEVKKFLPELQKKASPTEWTGLKEKEGQWPAYSREMIRLAKVHDLSVPGAMLPGPPSLWEKTYNPPRQPMRPGPG